jgi:NTE family protein
MKNPLASLLPGRAANAQSPQTTKRINLALQGGGAHGAFTWGVLEHLLSDERISFEGISGTSAGAVNAVMLADGLARGGRTEAQKRLADFWRAVSNNGNLPPLQRAVVERFLSFVPLEGTPMQAWLDMMARYFSPYDFNPLNINPLKELFERFVDFEALRAFSDLQLFISATNVQTGRVRIFSRDKVTPEALMASACLPLLFRAVDRRRAVLGRRLSCQSRDLSVFWHDDDGRCSGRANQSAGAAGNADFGQRDHEPHQRDYV